MSEKWCSGCKTPKHTDLFSKHRGRSDGLQATCKECRNRAAKIFRQTDPERASAPQKKWGKANREYMLVHNKKKYKENPAPKKLSASVWAKNNRDKKNAAWHRYQAKKRGNGGSYTQEELLALLKQYNNSCAYCLTAPYEHLDHDIPISRGGTSNIWNMLPSCAACNLQKGDMTATEYRLKKQSS